MMRWCVLACCAATLQAAAVRGIVIDNFSGRPLARSLVTLQAVAGYGAPVNLSVRADRGGVFAFPPVGAGAYRLTAARPGFATLKYGQKAWNAPGIPIFLDQEGNTFLQLRLRRLAAITGSVWDENEIGFPEQDVVAYRATRPPKLVTRAKTDDRGIYRIGLLEPGHYVIRTMSKQIDNETGLLPTFHKEGAAVDDAVPIQVGLEEQATDINVRPMFGRLCRLSGVANPPPSSLVLVSDMGEMGGGASGGSFQYENLAPGTYELMASVVINRSLYGAYQRLNIERDTEINLNLQASPAIPLTIEEKEGRRLDARTIGVFARRKTLAGEGASQRLTDRTELPPGRWELEVTPPADFYPVSIVAAGVDLNAGGRATGWHELLIGPGRFVNVRVLLSAKPAGVQGKVTGPGNDPVIGAPVYLEALDENSRKRVGPLTGARTDARGAYQFGGLAPGPYRLLSTFDFEDPDEETMEAARAKIVVLKEANTAAQDLDLYVK